MARKELQAAYAREIKKRDARIEELEQQLRILERLLLRSVGEKLEHIDRVKRKL